jgi:hypothetical protein
MPAFNADFKPDMQEVERIRNMSVEEYIQHLLKYGYFLRMKDNELHDLNEVVPEALFAEIRKYQINLVKLNENYYRKAAPQIAGNALEDPGSCYFANMLFYLKDAIDHLTKHFYKQDLQTFLSAHASEIPDLSAKINGGKEQKKKVNFSADFDVFGVPIGYDHYGNPENYFYFQFFYSHLWYAYAKQNPVFEISRHDGRNVYVGMLADDENTMISAGGRAGSFFAFAITLEKGAYFKNTEFLKKLFTEVFNIFSDKDTGIVYKSPFGHFVHNKNIEYGEYSSGHAKACINRAKDLIIKHFSQLGPTFGEREGHQSAIPEYNARGQMVNRGMLGKEKQNQEKPAHNEDTRQTHQTATRNSETRKADPRTPAAGKPEAKKTPASGKSAENGKSKSISRATEKKKEKSLSDQLIGRMEGALKDFFTKENNK